MAEPMFQTNEVQTDHALRLPVLLVFDVNKRSPTWPHSRRGSRRSARLANSPAHGLPRCFATASRSPSAGRTRRLRAWRRGSAHAALHGRD